MCVCVCVCEREREREEREREGGERGGRERERGTHTHTHTYTQAPFTSTPPRTSPPVPTFANRSLKFFQRPVVSEEVLALVACTEIPEDGGRGRLYLTLHCHHRKDPCIKMGGDEGHFNVSLTVRDKITGQCPQTTIFFEERGEPKRNRTEVLLFTSLTRLTTRGFIFVIFVVVVAFMCFVCDM